MNRFVFIALPFILLSCDSHHEQDQTQTESPTYVWSQVATTPTLYRVESSVVYDSDSDRLILFGGRDRNWNESNDTWEYNPAENSWRRINTIGSPWKRQFHAMVYDSIGKRAILFGGYEGDEALGDLWAFDYDEARWETLPNEFAPAPRYMNGLVFDSANNSLVLFGGRIHDGNSQLQANDTWIYSLDELVWEKRTPAISPPARDHISMAYDPESGNTILFGGNGSGGTLGDTWTFDLAQNAWEKMGPDNAPSPRDHNILTYSPDLSGVLLVSVGMGETTDCCWTYRAIENTWIDISPAGKMPEGRDHMQGALTPNGLFFFGGFSGGPGGARGDFWVLKPVD